MLTDLAKTFLAIGLAFGFVGFFLGVYANVRLDKLSK